MGARYLADVAVRLLLFRLRYGLLTLSLCSRCARPWCTEALGPIPSYPRAPVTARSSLGCLLGPLRRALVRRELSLQVLASCSSARPVGKYSLEVLTLCGGSNLRPGFARCASRPSGASIWNTSRSRRGLNLSLGCGMHDAHSSSVGRPSPFLSLEVGRSRPGNALTPHLLGP